MKRLGLAALCVVGACAISATTVASASAAAPEYMVCAKASPEESGKYNNKTCTEASKGGKKEGDYELANWEHAKKPGFKTKSGASTYDVYIPGTGVVGTFTCGKSEDVGTITGAKTATDVVLFEKCGYSGKTCTGDQAGTKRGDIETYTLDETLFNSAESGSGVAEELKGAGPGGLIAAFNCEGEEWSWGGALSGEVTGDVEVISKVSHIIFETTAEGAPDIVSSEPFLATINGVGTLPSWRDPLRSVRVL